MRPFNFAIIDEVDSVLLDSAQTPLVISGSPRVQSNYYAMINTLMTTLVEDQDYIFKEEKGEVWLTTKGAKLAENYLGISNLCAKMRMLQFAASPYLCSPELIPYSKG